MKASVFIISLLFLLPAVHAQKKAPAKPAHPAVKHTSGVVVTKKPMPKDTFVEISTIYGNMLVQLYKETPLHRSNFIKLVASGFYDSLLFHRVIKDFMIQGGDPLSKYADSAALLGSGDVGYRIPAEFNKNLYHRKGALAAARDNNPEKASSGCQFYLVQGKKITAQELSGMINGVNYSNKMMLLQEYTARDSVKAKLEDYNMRGDQAGLEKYMQQVKTNVDAAFESQMYAPSTMQVAEYINYGGTPHLDGNYTVFGQVVSGIEVIDKIASEKTNPAARPLKDIMMKMKIVVQ